MKLSELIEATNSFNTTETEDLEIQFSFNGVPIEPIGISFSRIISEKYMYMHISFQQTERFTERDNRNN